jgi:hypothetical protein
VEEADGVMADGKHRRAGWPNVLCLGFVSPESQAA